MNEQEYKQWRADALVMLNLRYTPIESRVIIEWMDRIKGAGERDLVGPMRDHLDAILHLDTKWNLYNSLTYRMWLYAPHILVEDAEYLEEYKAEALQKHRMTDAQRADFWKRAENARASFPKDPPQTMLGGDE